MTEIARLPDDAELTSTPAAASGGAALGVFPVII
jgi:hypothetical protein